MSIWILILLAFLILSYPSVRRHLVMKRWRKQLCLTKHEMCYQKLFETSNGFLLSSEARVAHDALEYTYGEIDFISFIALLSLVKPNKNTIFYDLGSGIGKAVIACAMVYEVRKCCGIELFALLHNAALKHQNSLKALPGYQDKERSIQFIHDTFLNADFSDATIIFINATAFFGPTWDELLSRLLPLKSGTLIITTSKPIRLSCFRILQETTVQMSWGTVQAFIQERVIEKALIQNI